MQLAARSIRGGRFLLEHLDRSLEQLERPSPHALVFGRDPARAARQGREKPLAPLMPIALTGAHAQLLADH
jgi:hypothetical protein